MTQDHKDLRFDEVTEALLSALPELRERYERDLMKWWGKGPERPGQYIVFGFVVKPALKDLLGSGTETDTLPRLFDFFETMANSSDAQVVNLLGIELFEWLLDDKKLLSKAWKYAGSTTKIVARRTAELLHCGQNIPRE